MTTDQNTQIHADSGVRAGGERAVLPPHPTGPDAQPGGPRVVTTGGKIGAEGADSRSQAPKDVDPSTGEPFTAHFVGGSQGFKIIRHLTPDLGARPGTAQIDALAFTVVPPADESMRWLVAQMQRFLVIDQVEPRRGCFAFKESIRFGGGAGLVAWGGASQRGRVYFSIQGIGSARVNDWAALSDWLYERQATLKRVDVAYDDFAGEIASIEWAIEHYRGEGFNAGGRKPGHQVFGDWLRGEESIKGRTLAIGNRASGKLCRVYEKGKQLGESSSPWTRIEVEWHGKDRLLPYDMLVAPGKYLAGAYPCLAILEMEQVRIKTIANSASISFNAAILSARQQTGKLVNYMLGVYGGDVGAVVERLRRDGQPARLEPYEHHLRDNPEQLDRDAAGSFAARGLIE